MPEAFRLFLGQMIQKFVAEVLVGDGHDVVRASETGEARADEPYWKKRFWKKELWSPLTISEIGLFYLWIGMPE